MSKKIVVSLLSISLTAGLTLVTLNPSSVMAAVGLKGLDVNALEKAQNEAVEAVRKGLKDLAQKMDKKGQVTYSSEDGLVVIDAVKDDKSVSVSIDADANFLPDMDYKDIGKMSKAVQDYLKPAFNEKQTKGLCGLLIGDAYAQYKKGKIRIKVTKEYEGLTIECSGNVNTGLLKVKLKGTLGVKECQPSKSKTTEMKVLPL